MSLEFGSLEYIRAIFFKLDPEQLNLCLLLETVSQFVLSLSYLTIVKEEVGRGWYNLRIYSSFECVTDLTTFEIYYEI